MNDLQKVATLISTIKDRKLGRLNKTAFKLPNLQGLKYFFKGAQPVPNNIRVAHTPLNRRTRFLRINSDPNKPLSWKRTVGAGLSAFGALEAVRHGYNWLFGNTPNKKNYEKETSGQEAAKPLTTFSQDVSNHWLQFKKDPWQWTKDNPWVAGGIALGSVGLLALIYNMFKSDDDLYYD